MKGGDLCDAIPGRRGRLSRHAILPADQGITRTVTYGNRPDDIFLNNMALLSLTNSGCSPMLAFGRERNTDDPLDRRRCRLLRIHHISFDHALSKHFKSRGTTGYRYDYGGGEIMPKIKAHHLSDV